MKRLALALLALLWATTAQAANCTWQGGTGTWNNASSANWTCGHVPTSSDVAIFNSTSGGGTVTVDSPNGAGIVDVQQITMGQFSGGTLDFSVNNNNVTLQVYSNSNISTRTIKMGSGAWTITGANNARVWDMAVTTNGTCDTGTASLTFTNSSPNFGWATMALCNFTNNTVTIGPLTGGGYILIDNGPTIGTLVASPPANIMIWVNVNIINAINWTGTSSNPINLFAFDSGIAASLSLSTAGTMRYVNVRDINAGGGAGVLTLYNSFNMGNNTNMTFNTGGAGGGACILGGWLLWRDLPGHIGDNFPAWLEKEV